jgi:hypothetical protein
MLSPARRFEWTARLLARENRMGDQSKPAPLHEAEFTALRAEILQRAQFQQQLASLSVISAGTLMTLFFQVNASSWLPLIYPLLAVFMAAEWCFNNNRILQIGRYIREEMEGKGADVGWEHYLRSRRAKTSVSWLSGKVLAQGTFVVLPLMVLAVGLLSRPDWSAPKVLVASTEAILLIVVVPLLVHYSER